MPSIAPFGKGCRALSTRASRVLSETAPWRNCSMATAAEVKRARRAKRAAATLDDPPPQPILRAASANDCVATKLGWLTQYQWGTADATAAPTVPEV